MCIICIELDNNRLSPWEAKRNLREMAEVLEKDHLLLVKEKISDAILNETPFIFEKIPTLDEAFCDFCDSESCLCLMRPSVKKP